MKWIVHSVILVSLIASGCTENKPVNDHTFQLNVSRQSVVSSKSITLHIDLFTEGERTVLVDRGQDRRTQADTSSSSNAGRIPGTAQIVLTAKLKSEGGSSVFEKESEIRSNSASGGGSSSGTVNPNMKLSDLASFVVESGEYTYGEEVLLGTVEGDQWILTVK